MSVRDLKLSRTSTAELVESDYFRTHPAPAGVQTYARRAAVFAEQQAASGRRVALVTSGGTIVPLERQTVRFLDNFSAGTRGAVSAEHLLDAGYAVVFLHRRFSLLPYARVLNAKAEECMLDLFEVTPQILKQEQTKDREDQDDGVVSIRADLQSDMRRVLNRYRAAQEQNRLLLIPFTTVDEYLWSLREIARALQPLGSAALFYLAAAVSDFFVPEDRLSEHKIQSSDTAAATSSLSASASNSSAKTAHDTGSQAFQDSTSKKLVIDLDPVPKFLKRLVDGWAPSAMVVSFKLETDPALLLHKARAALERYSHHLVIGNILATRAREVVLVTPDGAERWVRLQDRSEPNAAESRTSDPTPLEIEALIVPEVVALHAQHIQSER